MNNMRSKIKIRFSTMILFLTLSILLTTANVAKAYPGWHLSSSSLSTNVSSYQHGSEDDGAVAWAQYATATASYSAGNGGLSVSDTGSAFSLAQLEGSEGGGYGEGGVASFEANANANWAPNGGGGGPAETITTSGNLTGYTGVTNNIQYSDEITIELLSSSASGTATATASADSANVLDTTSFVSLTNSSDATFTKNNASYTILFSLNTNYYNSYNGYTESYSITYAEVTISWTNSYNTADGATSLSGASSIEGIATANFNVDDPNPDQVFVEGAVNMSGSVSIDLSAYTGGD
jgi:hypothetical protein